MGLGQVGLGPISFGVKLGQAVKLGRNINTEELGAWLQLLVYTKSLELGYNYQYTQRFWYLDTDFSACVGSSFLVKKLFLVIFLI